MVELSRWSRELALIIDIVKLKYIVTWVAYLSHLPFSTVVIFFLNLIFLTTALHAKLPEVDHPQGDPDLLLDLSVLLDLELW